MNESFMNHYSGFANPSLISIEEFFRISPAMGMPVRGNALIAAEKNYSYASKAKRKK
jgi:hypothetical protein